MISTITSRVNKIMYTIKIFAMMMTILSSTTLMTVFAGENASNSPTKTKEINVTFGSIVSDDGYSDLYIKLINESLDKVYEIQQTELFYKNNKTLYDTYSSSELELLFRIVEAEATDYNIECKSHVASVIFNRLKIGWWDGDLTKNLMANRQFEVVTNGRYKRITVTEETIRACEIAFENDTAQGALFFDSTKGGSWAHANREYLFKDDAHWFYK